MNITLYGDSILKGVLLEEGKYKMNRSWEQRLAAEHGVVIRNRARFGCTIGKALGLIEKDCAAHWPEGELALLEFGGNDCDFNWKEVSADPEKEHFPMSRIEDFVETYTNIIREIKSLGKIPVLLSLPPIDSNRYFNQISKGLSAENILKWMEGNRQFITNWHERYNIEIFKLAIAEEVPVIDITSVFLEHKNYSHYLCEDGIHPNEKGQKLIAEAIKAHVKRRNIRFDEKM